MADICESEIKIEGQKKGGVTFEVILSEPQVNASPKRPPSPVKTQTSLEEIRDKLKAAEERRQSLEAQKMSQLADKWSRIEVASQKKAEDNNNFIIQTKEQLDKKMEAITENRESFISGLRAKLKEHEEKIMEIRKSLDKEKTEIKENIDKKLATAEEKRLENLKLKHQKVLEKLKEHEENLEKVRRAEEERVQQLEEHIERKLEIAQEKREAVIKKKLENLKEHVKHVLEVKQLNEFNVQAIGHQTEFQLQKRLEKAIENRKEHEMACKAKRLKRDRHIEEVRQIKTQTSSG